MFIQADCADRRLNAITRSWLEESFQKADQGYEIAKMENENQLARHWLQSGPSFTKNRFFALRFYKNIRVAVAEPSRLITVVAELTTSVSGSK